MRRTGVLAGTIMMERCGLIQEGVQKLMSNQYGEVPVIVTDRMVFIVRHGRNPAEYILPHKINHLANLQALKDLGVSEVVGINSTGSLKKHLCPGMIVIPDDFITFTATPTIFENQAVHVTPSMNESVRQGLIAAAKDCKLNVVEQGVYLQVTGPRLETRAEIRMMAHFADIVGMTMASEAVIALEMGLPYASACSIDNFGNGLMDKSLSMEEIVSGTRKNADRMIKLLESYTGEKP
ncbi:MAG: MTAP family purine nucleoside phosphorylase [Syntrophaceae bacterium]|jgi:5'-methylthioadenosine phosphorylase|nr:MTAP family purine nucleoside phosphorylase [Syntrophaceae bacterium]HOC59272.1 MTAP family purine nucleoside phosphorylase [Smithellaceae bacterium]HQM45752.1 MTAP family purine nucleoside phosphorylase [Smithellaceae bacterium]